MLVCIKPAMEMNMGDHALDVLHSLGQEKVCIISCPQLELGTWLHLAAREAGKPCLVVCLGRRAKGCLPRNRNVEKLSSLPEVSQLNL